MAGIKRSVLLLLLCAALLTTAFASAPTRSDISIRITPPGGEAVQRAEAEVQLTDNTGSGIQAAHVRLGDASWREVTGQLDRTDNRYRYIAEVTENCAISVRVIGQDGTVFEKSEDISCFTASPGDTADKTGKEDSGKTVPLTPDGQGSVLDNATGEDGKEFFTFKTPNENVFYLIVDRQKNSENVYFLNAVTESDLMDLAEKEDDPAAGTETPPVSAIPETEPEPVCDCKDKCIPGEVKTDCPVCVLKLKDCTGKVPPDDSQEKTDSGETAKKGGAGMVFIVLIALVVGGAGWYFKIYKPKHELDDADDFNEVIGRETVNEDDAEEEPGAVPARFAYDNTGNELYARGRPEEPDEPNPPDSEPEPDDTREENPGTGLKRRFEPEDYGIAEADEPEPPEDEPEDY